MMGGAVGRASAIKMCYASLSKGAAALNASALISAMNLGIYDEFYCRDGVEPAGTS